MVVHLNSSSRYRPFRYGCFTGNSIKGNILKNGGPVNIVYSKMIHRGNGYRYDLLMNGPDDGNEFLTPVGKAQVSLISYGYVNIRITFRYKGSEIGL